MNLSTSRNWWWTFRALLIACVFACTTSVAHCEIKPDLSTFDQRVKPLLQKYCVRCHGSKTTEAEIRFDNIDPDIVTGEHFGKWEDAREAFNTGEMPPRKEPQPTPAERDVITRWLDSEFKKAKQYGVPNRRGAVRRLTRYELRYALEDLLSFPVQEKVEALPEEGTSVETGLKNSARLLMISGPHLEAYLNVILSVIDEMKAVAAFQPHRESVDIENLDINPPAVLGSNGRKHKPPVGKVERAGKGVLVNAGGYIDLRIRSISKYMFQTSISAKADGPATIQVSIGFTHSQVDPRQKVAELGGITIEASDQSRTYTLNSYPEALPREMTRALDRPFFVRITNRSPQKIYLEAFDYKGDVNTELTSTLIPDDVPESEIDEYVSDRIRSFLARAFRKAPSDAEFERYFGIYRQRAEMEDAILALLDTYKEILCSPRFFYIGLSGDLPDSQKRNYALTEKLAFSLWCSVPDDLLLESAAAGELTTPSVLAAHVERMLNDEKSRRWVENFTDQWLQTSMLLNVAVDRKYYPRFKDSLKPLMRQETIEAINDVFRNDSSALNLLKAGSYIRESNVGGFLWDQED